MTMLITSIVMFGNKFKIYFINNRFFVSYMLMYGDLKISEICISAKFIFILPTFQPKK